MRFRLFLVFVCLALPAISMSQVTVYSRLHWGMNRNNLSACKAPPGMKCTTPQVLSKSGSAPAYEIMGRWGAALRLQPETSGGFLSQPLSYLANQGPYDGGYGAAWMAYVWVDEMPSKTSNILQWSGNGSASFSLSLDPRGVVSVGYGQQNAWRGRLIATHRIGRKSWHHVAFVYQPVGNGIVRLLVNGVEQASAVLPLAGGLDQNPIAPVAMGTSRYNSNSDLPGKLDEVKLIQFSPASGYVEAVRNEHALHFRNRVIEDMIAMGRLSSDQVDRLNEPTFDSTSLLRAHVAAFYSAANACQPAPNCPRPRDPLKIAVGASKVDYVYPLNSLPTIYGDESGDLNGRYNSLYLNLSEPCAAVGPGCGEAGRPRVTGYCGSAALTLWAVYKAFGFTARKYDFINGTEFDYNDSHVLTSVYVIDPGAGSRFLMQDPTFNVSGKVGSNYYSVEEFPSLRELRPTLDDGGYDFFGAGPDRQISRFADRYWNYFNGLVQLYPAWEK